MMRETKAQVKAPGKHYREGLTIIQLFQMFPDDATAEKWLEDQRWPDERCCPGLRIYKYRCL